VIRAVVVDLPEVVGAGYGNGASIFLARRLTSHKEGAQMTATTRARKWKRAASLPVKAA
jgi:hypothetical protein